MPLFGRRVQSSSVTVSEKSKRGNARRRAALRAASLPVLEALDPRINFGNGVNCTTDVPPQTPPTCNCPPKVVGSDGGTGTGGYAAAGASSNPVLYESGQPIVNASDLVSDAFGKEWGHMRSWVGVDDASQNGNGWMVTDLPYLVIVKNQIPDAHDGIIQLVESGGSSRAWDIGQYNDFEGTLTPRGLTTDQMTYIPPSSDGAGNNLPGYYVLTDSGGNVTTFYDLPRGNSDNSLWGGAGYAQEPTNQYIGFGGVTTDMYRFGAFRSYTDASSNYTVTTTYDPSTGNLTDVVRTDGSGAYENFHYEYATVTNATTGASASLISRVSMRDGSSASGPWTTIRAAEYTYYTGDGADADDGRLGDLKLATIKDYQQDPANPVIVDQTYYRYYKFHTFNWFNDNVAPTNGMTADNDNDTGGTGGTDMTFPAAQGYDNAVLSGLKAVVDGQNFAALKANFPSYESLPDVDRDPTADANGDGNPANDDIRSYANNFFRYQRYDSSDDEYTDVTVARYRVVEETAAGSGCTLCTGGFGTSILVYAANPSAKADPYDEHDHTVGAELDPNTWVMKTTEYLPDDTVTYATHALSPGDLTASDTTMTLAWSGHGFAVGDYITISGADQQLFDGTFQITAVTADTISYEAGFEGLGSFTATGSIRATASGGWGDNDYNVVYTNEVGQIMLNVQVDRHGTASTSDDTQTLTYYHFDAGDRNDFIVYQSALVQHSGAYYDEALPDLVNFGSGTSGYPTYVSSTDGLIEHYIYATSTTAGLGNGTSLSDTSGDVANYLQTVAVRHGYSGSDVPVAGYTYYAQTYLFDHYFDSYTGTYKDIYTTAHPVAKEITYVDTNGDGTDDAVVTQHTYTYVSDGKTTPADTTRIATDIVHLPAVSSTSHNGSGSSDSEEVVYDTVGRPVWTKDGDGYLTYTAYDPATGAVIESVVDADPSLISGAPVASPGRGWTGGPTLPAALNLVTAYVVDGLGRTTEETDPNGNVTYTVYNDGDHEVRVYRGWQASTGTTTGPIEVTREHWATAAEPFDYTETLTSSATPTVDVSGRPTGQETIDASNIQSLTRTINNTAGQAVETDAYFSLAGQTYSQATLRIGTASNDTASGNYHQTLYAYKGAGALKRVQSATGTITRYVYDARGNVTETWVGTDDTPTSGYWSPTNTAGTDLVMVEQRAYDGDGNLTTVTQYPGGGAAARVTEYAYDWRDRLVITKTGVQGTGSDNTGGLTQFYQYNNQGQVINHETYAGDSAAVADANSDGVPDAPSTSLRRSKTTTSYDELGRAYRTDVFYIDATDGSTGTHSYTLHTDTYYDARGNVIETRAPGGLVTETAYDGAGRAVTVWQSDGAGGTAYTHAGNVTGDTVLAQTDYTYDGNGNVILQVVRQRFDNAYGDGGLGTVQGATGPMGPFVDPRPAARVSYEAFYYDAANRQVADVNFGTNGGLAFTRPDAVPARSDTVLVTSYSYGQNEVQRVTLTGNPTGGTFTLTLNGQTTAAIAYNANAAAVQSALAALSTIGSGNVAVSGLAGDWAVTFTGSLAGQNVNQMTADASALTGGTSPAAAVSTFADGSGDETQTITMTNAPDGGTFTLTFEGQTTAALAYNASATTIQSALAALSTIGTGNVLVTGSFGKFTVTFTGALAGRDLPQITADSSALTNAPLAGDVNGDDVVDNADQNIVLSHWENTVPTGTDGDISGPGGVPDGLVDTYDLNLVNNNFGRTSGPPVALVLTAADGQTGRLAAVTDPKGNRTVTSYDLLGRTTRTVAAYTDGIPSNADDQTTQYTYDGSDHVLSMRAVLPFGAFQETKYIYDTDTVSGSALHSKDLLSAVQYPDPTTGAASTSPSQQESYTYDALGEKSTYTDRNGTTHAYRYDALGRLTADVVTALGAGVAGMDMLTYGYDSAGNANDFSTLGAAKATAGLTQSGGTATLWFNSLPPGGVNDYIVVEGADQAGYNGKFQILSETVINAGSSYVTFAVDSSLAATATGTITARPVLNEVRRVFNGLGQMTAEYQSILHGLGDTPTGTKVTYQYNEMADGANNSRPTSITYPDGRVVTYTYNTGIDDAISRISSVNGSAGESYVYLGLDTVVERNRPVSEISLSYVKQGSEGDGDAGDRYTGLDRFGRVVDQRWTDGTGAAADRLQYGYDRDGNALWRDDLVHPTLGQLYSYDKLNRLTSYQQGTLNSTRNGFTDSPNASNNWTLDATGNATNAWGESNVFNAQNERTIDGSTPMSYDANGNETAFGTGSSAYTYTYDAWNRLVSASVPGGDTVDYTYDALGRQTIAYDETTDQQTDRYYDSNWQVVEERDPTIGVTAQFVWSPVLAGAMVASYSESYDSKWVYVQQDANGNVTSLADTGGAVVERYSYDPYGTATVLDASGTAISGSAYNWHFLFQGQRYDAAMGLYDFRHRAYDPYLGRFLQQDPMGYVDGTNLYQMARGNPVNRIDPMGTDSAMGTLDPGVNGGGGGNAKGSSMGGGGAAAGEQAGGSGGQGMRSGPSTQPTTQPAATGPLINRPCPINLNRFASPDPNVRDGYELLVVDDIIGWTTRGKSRYPKSELNTALQIACEKGMPPDVIARLQRLIKTVRDPSKPIPQEGNQ